ncbi:MAG: YggS family pyridoxal phosphate-dependent enzyme [Bacteroidales bacterium]|jgi:pyridoxal phosphate enzyme (YggS family)|nr:YggS family pyridoxal phosphate-dependent enzyme [Bacteroidales bacterium]
MSIRDNILNYNNKITGNARLIAVSKTKPVEDLQEAYEAGQRLFGENKALEMRDKHEILPKDIRWHFIGHLQTNKVKYIAPFVELIHSVDSLNLLKQINKEAIKNNRVIDCLLQIDIAHEETKFGLEENEADELLSSEEFAELKNVRICGLMGIGSITDDKNKTKKEFNNLKKYFDETKNKFFNSKSYFCELSMGMSQDFELAIEEGATLVRIGSSIFGARDYASKN